MPKRSVEGAALPGPPSIAKSIAQIAKLDRKVDCLTLRKLIERVERGEAYEEDVRWLLIKFCRGARKVRRQFPLSTVPLLIEFVARRITLFLIGKEPDLMQAFGLKRPTRGRKPKRETRDRAVFIAARVHELMQAGASLEKAAASVAEDEGMSESTARDHYAENKSEAKIVLMRKELTRCREERIAARVREFMDAGKTLRKAIKSVAREEGMRKTVTCRYFAKYQTSRQAS